ncbi:MAG: hypothetical protein WKF40_09965 [Thermoleophilaceae bacterium]
MELLEGGDFDPHEAGRRIAAQREKLIGRGRAAGEEAGQRAVRGARAGRGGRGRAGQAGRLPTLAGAPGRRLVGPGRWPRPSEYLLGLELFGMRFGLDRMHRLSTALGMPQRRFAPIHVVGSNGKSSTVRFIAAILERHGLRTGSYTSPHLTSFTERIEVAERPVSSERFAAAVHRAAKAVDIVERAQSDPGDAVTQFEALTAAAYHELAAQKVEVAVIEAGLGGRYDATNVIPSGVQVLTGVGLEHTRWLGPTVGDIAEEKLAVVRDHSTLVTGPLHPEAEAVADRVVAERHAGWVRSPAPSARTRCGRRASSSARTSPSPCAAAEALPGSAAGCRRGGRRRRADAHSRPPGSGRRPSAGAARRRPQSGRRAGAGRGAPRA